MTKTKKLLTGVAAAVLLMSLGATTAFASDTWQSQGRLCTDANGDGICDHAASNCQFLDANQDGVCDRCGLTCRGTGWVDADGDGVCDHYSAGSCYGGHCGSGHGYGHGRHCR